MRTILTYLKRLSALAMLVGGLWSVGFIFFVTNLDSAASEPVSSYEKRDAAVVLTGGGGRIGRGLQLLRDRYVDRMLISGVHPSVKLHEIIPRTSNPDLMDKIELEAFSEDTVGNAVHSATWLHRNDITTVYLVTADYHMPRALMLFRSQEPHIDIAPVSVVTNLPLSGLMREYTKYLAMRAQLFLGLGPDVDIDLN